LSATQHKLCLDPLVVFCLLMMVMLVHDASLCAADKITPSAVPAEIWVYVVVLLLLLPRSVHCDYWSFAPWYASWYVPVSLENLPWHADVAHHMLCVRASCVLPFLLSTHMSLQPFYCSYSRAGSCLPCSC
jgi:hypothetical protein